MLHNEPHRLRALGVGIVVGAWQGEAIERQYLLLA